jgi:phage FluMu protein gp41
MQLKLSQKQLGHWDHFKRVAVAVSVPAGVELARVLLVAVFQVIGSVSRRQISRLEKQRKSILKELKVCSAWHDPDSDMQP